MRLTKFLLALLLAITLAACQTTTTTPDTELPVNDEQPATENPTPETPDPNKPETPAPEEPDAEEPDDGEPAPESPGGDEPDEPGAAEPDPGEEPDEEEPAPDDPETPNPGNPEPDPKGPENPTPEPDDPGADPEDPDSDSAPEPEFEFHLPTDGAQLVAVFDASGSVFSTSLDKVIWNFGDGKVETYPVVTTPDDGTGSDLWMEVTHRYVEPGDYTVTLTFVDSLGNEHQATEIVQISTHPTELGEVRDVSTGNYHSLLVDGDGHVWAWGYNYSGQLGDGTNTPSYWPLQVDDLNDVDVVSVSAGSFYSLALDADGHVWAWGTNSFGQLGDGTTTTTRRSPVQVTGLIDIVSITSGSSHSLAIDAEGKVWAWGSNNQGQLGVVTVTTNAISPVQVDGLNDVDVVGIAAGSEFSLALDADGNVWAWGSNATGQLGNGANDRRSYEPVAVNRLANITSIAVGRAHSLALDADGKVWAWGRNALGELGDGTQNFRRSPVEVHSLNDVDVVSIATGFDHSFARDADGNTWAWGSGEHGQLGNGSGSAVPRYSPAMEEDLSHIVSIASGSSSGHSLGIDADGNLWAWGRNTDGQLGDGTNVNRFSPVRVDGY